MQGAPPQDPTPPSAEKPRLRLSLRTAAVAFSILFGLLLAGPLAWFNYSRSSEAALAVAGDLAAMAGANIGLNTRQLMQPVTILAEHVRMLPGSTAKTSGFEHPLLPLFLHSMGESPQIYSVYFGEGDGTFWQLISFAGRPQLAAERGAPAGALFAQRLIGGRDGLRRERWRFLDRQGRELGQLPPAPAKYDPRERPWFVSASQMDGVVRTKPYVFQSTKAPGLTVAQRVPGSRPLVFGVDITLESLARHLASEAIGPSGLIFLFDSDGGLMGHPDAAQAARGSVEAQNDPRPKALMKRFVEGGKHALPLGPLSVDGVEYLAQVLPMEEMGSDSDYLGILLLPGDFTAPLAKTRDQSLFIALGFILVVAPALGLLAGRLSRTVGLLAEEADRIRALDLASTRRLESRIDEMDRLGSAVASMRCALSSFSRYLPRTLVKQFIDSGVDPELGGERREVTLLFTDVENFTPMAEHLAPEDLMQAMSEYFQLVSTAILDCGGTLDKFIGDAVMAFWNAPFNQERHVEQACLAALMLSRASEDLNLRRGESSLPILRTRLGLHTGPVVVGNVGSADRMDYTALGANVNLASRLEGLNKFYGTRILASRAVRDRAKAGFLFRSVDVVVPKGAEAPVAVFELMGAMPASPYAEVAADRALLGFCSRWERAITLYRTVQWDKAHAEFAALAAMRPDDRLAAMYATRARRLLENKPGKDWKAIERFKEK